MIRLPHRRAVVGVLAGAAIGLAPALLAGAGMLTRLVGADSPPVSPPVGYDSPSFCGPGPNLRPSPLSDAEQFAAGNGLIAYEANCRGVAQIFIAFPSGQGARPITTLGAHEPAWSPDSQRIAFVRGDFDSGEIFTTGLGGGETRLTSGANDQSPSWSPDGRSIVFSSTRQGVPRLYITDANASNVRALTTSTGLPLNSADRSPAWSPNGDLIVFARDNAEGSGNSALWTIHPDGTGLTRLTGAAPGRAIQPAWSPDGRQVVFAGGFPCSGGGQLYVIDADGSNLRRPGDSLPMESCLGRSPVWSPDGTRVLFALQFRCPCPDGQTSPFAGLYTMRPDGSDFRSVLADPTANEPSWQALPTVPVSSTSSSSSSTSTSSTTSTVAPTTTTTVSQTTTTAPTTTSTTIWPTTTTAPVNPTCVAIQAFLAQVTDPAQRSRIQAAALASGCPV